MRWVALDVDDEIGKDLIESVTLQEKYVRQLEVFVWLFQS